MSIGGSEGSCDFVEAENLHMISLLFMHIGIKFEIYRLRLVVILNSN